MPKKVQISFSIRFKDDFQRLRDILHKVEYMRDLVPDWHDIEAEEIHNEILEIVREMIEANGKT